MAVSTAPMIELKSASLELPARSPGQISTTAEQHVGGEVVRRRGRAARVRVLHEVSFSADPGMCIGILGLNGAGKSTLLRVLAGIYQPTSGEVHTNGRVTTLFTNQLGMNQNATGEENVRLMSLLLGIPYKKIPELIKDVAQFSELGEFMQLPIRTYSAGMRTRIGFGVASAANPEILLIDEIFGTGDHSFVSKARDRMHHLIEGSGVVVLASHSPDILKQYCSHALWLDRGRLMGFGKLGDVLPEYRERTLQCK